MDTAVPNPSYRLETFGKLALTGAASAGVSHQRRRLALLALLAAAGKNGLSRDQLIGYLWPESSSANGRHSLEQLLHGMRRALGESLFTGTNPVSLNSDVVASDVGEFQSALENGTPTDAVALVNGPFLQGFYLDDAPEFERWASSERSRLSRRFEEALRRLADDAAAACDYAALLVWRRKLVEVDPLGSRPALALMRALAASGDRTAALQHARVYESLVRQELDSGPDPSIVAYAAELRAGRDETLAGIAPPKPLHLDSPRNAVSQSQPVSEIQADTNWRPATTTTVTVDDSRRSSRNRWLLGCALAVVTVIAGSSLRNRGATPALDESKIVIVPFRITGADSSIKYLSEGVVDLLAPMLTGEGGPASVDARTAISTWNRITRGRDGTADDARQVARELGAGLVLSGSIVEVDGKLTITGSIISGTSGNARQLTSVSSPVDSINTLLDTFVGQLLARQSGVAETSLSSVTSQSLPAIRAYLSGRAAYRKADEARAIEEFTRALDLDSTFALDALDLAVATGRLVRTQVCQVNVCRIFSVVPGFTSSLRSDDLFDRALTLAWEHRSKLGKRDRPLLEALRGDSYPRESSARQTLVGLNRAIAAAPDRPETHYLLGVLLLYQGHALGLSDSRVRAEAAFRDASRLDSTYLGPLARAVDIDAFEGNRENIRRDGLRYLSYDNAGPTAEYVRWLVAVATSGFAEQKAISARFRSVSKETLEQIYMTSQMTGLGLDDADSVAKIVAESATDPMEKSVAYRRAQLLMLNRGRPREATEFLRRSEDLRTPSYTFPQFAIAAAIFNDGDRAVADSSSRVLARSFERDTLGALPPDKIRRLSGAMSVQALWYLDRNDTVAAARVTGWLRRHAVGQPRNRVLSILPEMLVASRARRPNGVGLRSLVDSIVLDGCCQLPDFVSVALSRAYEESGDNTSALRAIRRGIWYQPPRGLSTFLRDEGRLAAKLGDRAGAIRAYEHFLALRSNPEPSLRADANRIRSELNALKSAR